MNGKAIVINDVLGIYQVTIVNFDDGNRTERYESTCSRMKALGIAERWSNETGYPVRMQSGPMLSKVERRTRRIQTRKQ